MTIHARCNGSAFADDRGGSSTDSASFRTGGQYRVPRYSLQPSSTVARSNIGNGSTGGRQLPQSPRKRSSSPRQESIVTINVSGARYQTYESTLQRFPRSLLGDPIKRRPYWNQKHKEYFFDRHRSSFESILNIYQTGGQVLRPESVPITVYLRELHFFELGDEIVENFWESEGYKKPHEEVMPSNRLQRLVWELVEHPDSSLLARVFACVSVAVIVISIVSFCLETIPELKPELKADTSDMQTREWHSPFFFIELCCCTWFSIELAVRFASCPHKVRFMRSFLNWLDFVAVTPFFINLIWVSESGHNGSSISFSVLRIIRLVRVFRIFKLSRHSVGLQVLGKTFRASVKEFCLLIFFMVIALVLFSSGVYFAEQNEPDTKFTSIPASFWFVLATMTTVGYGDLVPRGLYGKIVGSMCALIGVLTLALPVPIIVANFKHFYRQECRLAQMYANINKKVGLTDVDLAEHDNPRKVEDKLDAIVTDRP